MKKLFLLFFLLLQLVLAGFSNASFDTFTTLSCGFSSPTRIITAKAVYYSSNSPACVSINLAATLPNGTKVNYGHDSCSNGVHSFSVSAPVNGVYSLNASYSGAWAACSAAALFFEQRPRLAELHPLAIILVGLAAIGFLRKESSR